MLRVEGLSKAYGARPALRDVSLDVPDRGVVGLLGPNGAGKTTLMRVVTGILPADGGRVEVNGRPPGSLLARREVGYLPETPFLYPEMKAESFVAYCARLRDVPRRRALALARESLERSGIPKLAGRRCGSLSKGQRQAVGLAQALVHDPPLLLLDEPAAGLDPVQASRLRGVLLELAKTKAVLLSTHMLGDVRGLCDRVVVLYEGQVVAADTPDAIAQRRGGPLEEALLDLLERPER